MIRQANLKAAIERARQDTVHQTQSLIQKDRIILAMEVERLQPIVEYLQAPVGGETVGDTLIQLAGLIVNTKWTTPKSPTTEDWRAWLRDCGARLNEAAKAAEEGKP